MVITSDSAALKAGLKTDSPKCVGKEGPGKENGRGEIERRSGRREGGRERDQQTDRQNDSSRSGKLVWASRVCPRKPCTEPHALGAFQQSVHRFLPFSKPRPPNFPGLHGESHSCSYRRSTNSSHSYCSTSGNCILEGDLNFSHSHFKVYMPSLG